MKHLLQVALGIGVLFPAMVLLEFRRFVTFDQYIWILQGLFYTTMVSAFLALAWTIGGEVLTYLHKKWPPQ